MMYGFTRLVTSYAMSLVLADSMNGPGIDDSCRWLNFVSAAKIHFCLSPICAKLLSC